MVIAGANVTVLGTGQALDPYIISANDSTFITANTDSITMMLTPGTPDVLSAAVNIDPIAGNLITVTAQGLRVDCSGVHGCFGAGAGIDAVQLAAGIVAVCLSSDANNVATLGTDGCLYVPAPGTAAVVLDPAATNILTQSGAGLLADIIVGCGLAGEGNAASPLRTVVDTTPTFACLPGAGGGSVYCDAASGQLYTDPEHFFIHSKVDQPVCNTTCNFNSLAPAGTQSQVGLAITYTITNPSPCRSMVLEVMAGVQHALMAQPPGGGLGNMTGEMAAGVTLSAPAVATTAVQNGHQHWQHVGTTNGNRAAFDTKGSFGITYYTLPPGATTTVTMVASFDNISNTGGVQATVSGWNNTAIIKGWTI